MKNSCKNLGFSLLEIMFIVILISLISVYHLQRKSNKALLISQKITVSEIQHIQAAALYYYSRNNYWPTDPQLLTTPSTDPITGQSIIYLNETDFCSPWVATQDMQTLEICSEKQLYQTEIKGNFFQVSVDVQSEKNAEIIASHLPTNSTGYGFVYSSVPIPGQFKGFITSAGVNDSTDSDATKWAKVYLPKCPSGYEGHFIISPQRQTTGQSSTVDLGMDNELQFDSDKSHYYYRASNDIDSLSIVDKEYLDYFMTFCLWAGNWQSDSRPSEVDAQCNGTDWLTYNGNTNGACHSMQTPL